MFSAIRTLKAEGFSNIELSGGSDYIEDLDRKLLVEKDKGLNFRLHNYFPPPQKHFVVNLCSNDNVVRQSLDLMKKSVDLSYKLESKKVGFHAGFKVSPKPEELGKAFSKTELINHKTATEKFAANFKIIKEYASQNGVEIYLENNVVSETNFKNHGGQDAFLLTTVAGLKELHSYDKFPLLLDIGHLKVSSKTHGLDFEKELSEMIQYTDYIHISDNSGLADDNNGLTEDGEMYGILKNLKNHLKHMDFTLEVYSGIDSIKDSHNLLSKLL